MKTLFAMIMTILLLSISVNAQEGYGDYKANLSSPTFVGTVTIPILAISSTSTFTGASVFTAGATFNGGATLGAGDDLIGSSTSDITFNTNKFTVAGATGNTLVAGTLEVTGLITGGVKKAGVVVTDGATYAVLAANSGAMHFIGDLSQNTNITLPVEAAGLNYEFWYIGAADDGHDHTIDSEANANWFIGGVSFADTDAGDAADEINAGIYSDGNSNSILTVNNASAGTVVKIVCDGTYWYMTGIVISDTAPAFSDN